MHSKDIQNWDDPAVNREKTELSDTWCSWCVQRTTHVVMGPGGLLNRKQVNTSIILPTCGWGLKLRFRHSSAKTAINGPIVAETEMRASRCVLPRALFKD